MEDRLGDYRAAWEMAARALSADFVVLADDLWEVRLGSRRTRIANHLVQVDDPVILRIAGDKPYCYRLARELHIPVPAHTVVRRLDLRSAWSFIARR
ncbi:MAG: hypothetical protein ACR2IK_06720, partial [Chloroflexota bacterium]